VTKLPIKVLRIHGIKFLNTLAIFGILLLSIWIFQPYYLAPPPGYIDPWVNLGYGQTFPETAFPGHYYKESRLLSILWITFVLIFPVQFYSQVILILISTTGFLAFKICRELRNGFILSLITALLVILNPLLWGDIAGGGDYYNTFGNFIVVVTIYRIILPLLKEDNEIFNRKRFFIETGIWLTIVTLEIPSGVIVSSVIFCFVAISYLWKNRIDSQELPMKVSLFHATISFGLGGLVLLVFETALLLSLKQNPIRLLSGPKFLFDSIFNSSTQANWWIQIPFDNLRSLPSLFLLLLIMCGYLASTLFLTLQLKENSLQKFNQLILVAVISLFSFILFGMQITGKTIALTTPYFTTPILLLLFICFSAVRNKKNSWFVIILFLPILMSDFSFDIIYVTLVAIFIFTIGTYTNHHEWMDSSFLILLLVLSIFLSGNSFNSSQLNQKFISKVCNSERLHLRSDLIEASEELDAYGPRGTILMGADGFIFSKTDRSKCPSFDDVPLSYYLISLSALGYPSAASLGTFAAPVQVVGNKFLYESFAHIANRQNPITGCYFNFVERETGKVITLSEIDINYEFVCLD
jgi:hypothetical protein